MNAAAKNINNNNNSSEENLNSSGQEMGVTYDNEATNASTTADGTKYVCPICEAISLTQHEFTTHIRNHNNIRDASDDTTSFTCRICSKVLSSASSLDRHVLVHTGERPFTCKFCHLTFTTNGNMHRHMRTHKQQQNDPYSLAPNRVSCPYCQRKFPWSSSLRRHILTHTGQKPFKCSQCPLLFTTKSNCDRHLLRKHDYANRKVICAFCLRRFWSTEDLRRHMRTHSGERPFCCDVCFRKFTLKHSMLRHRKKHSQAQNSNHMSSLQHLKAENGETNGNGSSINNSEESDEESNNLAMINHKKLMEMRPDHQQMKFDHEMMSRMMNPINKELFKFFNMQQSSDLIGNLLGISDQGILNKMFSSADEAAKLLGVEK
ncbi:unnamed protein product [Diamesa hyperborea]